jgi:SH3 domain protein
MRALLIFVLVLFAAAPSAAQTLYVSDMLTVPLRSGPSTAHRILHRGLPSGTELTRLGEDAAAGFTRVRTATGTEGWLETQYLVNEPIARARLDAALSRASRLERDLGELRTRFQEATANHNQAEAAGAALQQRVAALEAELLEVRQVSAGALEQNVENQQLKALNQRLRAEIDDLVGEMRVLEANQQQRWLLSGGGLVLGGLLLGAWLKSRSRSSSGWG